MNVVEIHHEEEGYVAVDSETGTEARGETRALALVALGTALDGAAEDGDDGAGRPDELRDPTAGLLDRDDLLDGSFHTHDDLEDLVKR